MVTFFSIQIGFKSGMHIAISGVDRPKFWGGPRRQKTKINFWTCGRQKLSQRRSGGGIQSRK